MRDLVVLFIHFIAMKKGREQLDKAITALGSVVEISCGLLSSNGRGEAEVISGRPQENRSSSTGTMGKGSS
jgi:hypothetical protein